MKGEAPRPIAPFWLRGKTRQAVETGAFLDYEVSLNLDMALLEEAGTSKLKRIRGVDPEPGCRLAIYALSPPHGSGMIQVNGAATHRILKGNPVPMPSAPIPEALPSGGHPQFVLLDDRNQIQEVHHAPVH